MEPISAVLGAAHWLTNLALNKLQTEALQAWADTNQLSDRVEQLREKLEDAQCVLGTAEQKRLDNPELEKLLRELRELAHEAEDLVDELEYFRIQDEVEGTNDAATEGDDDGGLICGCGGILHARHAALALAGKWLPCLPPLFTATAQCLRSATNRSPQPLSNVENSGDEEAPKFNRVEMCGRMQGVVMKLEPTCRRATQFLSLQLAAGRRDSPLIDENIMQIRETASFPTGPKFVGREEEEEEILGRLISPEFGDRNLSVLPIWGYGGLGKTTLARHVYNDPEVVGRHFHFKVWICVGLQFDVLRICREMLRAISEHNGETYNEPGTVEQCQNLILKGLKSNKFLMVLDDIWDRQDNLEPLWDKLLAPLRQDTRQASGNVILVTTRFPQVVNIVQTTHPIKLQGLKNTEFWKLFLGCVFRGENFEQHQTLLTIAKENIHKLKGFPLAAITVGALLRKKLTVDHWLGVLKNDEWKSQEQDHDIMPALRLSYICLPFHLQKCFSYCALFPDDYYFDWKELVHLWIALDIIHPNSENKRMEDIGLEYLDYLVNYGFLERTGRDKYVLHDLIHELARKVSSNECLAVDRFDHRYKQIPPSIRHLSIVTRYTQRCWVDTNEKFETELIRLKEELKVENIRTLIIIGIYDSNFAKILKDLMKEVKGLRVLRLPTIRYSFEILLENFEKYLHLRYLSLGSSYSTSVPLPSSLSRFYHLKILDLSHWNSQICNLPRDMDHLVNLRHFLGNEELHSRIVGVGRLKFLQELRRFNVGKDVNFKLRQLGELTELGGMLNICDLDNVSTKEEAHEAKLMEKSRLGELKLSWHSEQQKNALNVQEVIEGLQPHSQLQALHIMGHGGRTCPTWLGGIVSFNYLEALHLKSVAWESLPAFGQFPSLKKLYMEDISAVSEFGVTLFGQISEERFCSLQELSLCHMPELTKWVGHNSWCYLFSGLLVLEVKGCPKLMELPFSQFSCSSAQDKSMIWFPRLEKLHIMNCPQLMSLPVIPYTNTLRSVHIADVGLYFRELIFKKVPSKIEMTIEGIHDLDGLDEKVLAYCNLTDLQELGISNCPPLAWKHLQTLTSLKRLRIEECNIVLGEHDDAKRVLPIEDLVIVDCDVSGKELTELLSHLPALSFLKIENCRQIRRFGMEEEEQSMVITSPSAIAAASSSTNQQQQQQLARRKEVEDEESLLLLPSHLSTSLRQLIIESCKDLSLVGDLQGLRSLQYLFPEECPNLLSSYSSSGRCPFPSSLQTLCLWGMHNMDTMAPLSNLTSLTALSIHRCGDLRGDRWLQPLLTHNLTNLEVMRSPNFFAGWVLWAAAATQEKEEEDGVPNSWRLQELKTDDAVGFLVAPICSHLSSSLSTLTFSKDKQLQCFTEEQEKAIRLLTSLEALQFQFCCNLHFLPEGPPSLMRLNVFICEGIQSLSKQALPDLLRELKFSGCFNLHSLPERLHNLPSLLRLDITRCRGIQSLPKKGLPVSLQELHISDCSKELNEQCKKLKGIPKITIEEKH